MIYVFAWTAAVSFWSYGVLLVGFRFSIAPRGFALPDFGHWPATVLAIENVVMVLFALSCAGCIAIMRDANSGQALRLSLMCAAASCCMGILLIETCDSMMLQSGAISILGSFVAVSSGWMGGRLWREHAARLAARENPADVE